MHFNDQTLSILRSLGLTYYEAKAYYALIAVGSSGAAALSEKTAIPRSRIYDVLSRLIQEGWVNSTDSRPMQYSARNPREILGEKRERFVTDVNAASLELSSMYYQTVEKEPPNAWIVRGEEKIITRVLDLLKRARNEVLFLGSLYLPGEMDALERSLPMIQERGVVIRALVRESINTDKGEIMLADKLRRLIPEVRVMYAPAIKFIIADRMEVMIMFSSTTDEMIDSSNALAIWMPRSEVAELMYDNFNMLWNSEKPSS
ncbi:MAG: TrmB family transcriptional regulator [Euryarchaeota archaeon]|nr:TrmB family transcriptional regulator [Euryarchaeota archaeon]